MNREPCTHGEQLALFVLGDLQEAESTHLVQHLGQCRICQQEAAELRGLLEQVRSLNPSSPADSHFEQMRSTVLAQLSSPRKIPLRASWFSRPLVLAPLALGFCAALLWQRNLPPPKPNEVTQERRHLEEPPALDEPIWEEEALYLDPTPLEFLEELDATQLAQLDQNMDTGV